MHVWWFCLQNKILISQGVNCFFTSYFFIGILLWSARSDRLEPFMISANNDTGEWKIVGKSSNSVEYSVARTMQESVVGNFVKDWFKISKDNSKTKMPGKVVRVVFAFRVTVWCWVIVLVLYISLSVMIYTRVFHMQLYQIIQNVHRMVKHGKFMKKVYPSSSGKILDNVPSKSRNNYFKHQRKFHNQSIFKDCKKYKFLSTNHGILCRWFQCISD